MSPELLAAFAQGDDSAQDAHADEAMQFWLEDGAEMLGDGSYGLESDPLWARPGIYPIIEADVRKVYNDDGSGAFVFSEASPGILSASQYALSVATRVNWFFEATAAIWPAGKPRKYRLNIKGFDALDCSVRVGRHPADRFGAEIASPFSANARAELNAWSVGVFEFMRQELEGRGQRMPDGLLCNIESQGDTLGSWEAMEPWVLGDARASTELIDGVQTVAAWFAARSTTNTGAAYPAYPAGGETNPRHPNNWDRGQRIITAVDTAFHQTLYAGLFAPFRAVMGSGATCGNWQHFGNGLSPQCIYRPFQAIYDRRGWTRPGMIGVPVVYGSPQSTRADDSGTALDARWDSVSNWLAYFDIAGPPTTAKLREAGIRWLSALAQTVPRAGREQLCPSITTNDVSDGEATAAAAYVAGIKQWRTLGVRDVWLYQPIYAGSATQRAATLAIVQGVNG